MSREVGHRDQVIEKKKVGVYVGAESTGRYRGYSDWIGEYKLREEERTDARDGR